VKLHKNQKYASQKQKQNCEKKRKNNLLKNRIDFRKRKMYIKNSLKRVSKVKIHKKHDNRGE